MIFIFFYAIFSVTNGQEWVNDYDGYLYFECPEGQSISRLMSIHDNGHEDRMWAFECLPLEYGYDSCAWSGYVNNYDEMLLFECASGAGVVAGMESEHDNKHDKLSKSSSKYTVLSFWAHLQVNLKKIKFSLK